MVVSASSGDSMEVRRILEPREPRKWLVGCGRLACEFGEMWRRRVGGKGYLRQCWKKLSQVDGRRLSQEAEYVAKGAEVCITYNM